MEKKIRNSVKRVAEERHGSNESSTHRFQEGEGRSGSSEQVSDEIVAEMAVRS